MRFYKDMSWWYWLATVVLLASRLVLGWTEGVYLAMALCGVQVIHFAYHERDWIAFPVQVRMIYMAMLVLGEWDPRHLLLWIPLVGTTVFLLFGYCLLARTVSLLPWHRSEPLSFELLKRTFFTPPVRGNAMHGLSQLSASVESRCSFLRLKDENVS